jgi:uncharacterized protein
MARVIGLISDTHGLVRSEVHTALAGVELILHAGDVGGDEVLDELTLIAPIHAVYGNTDPPGQPRLRTSLVHDADGVAIRVTHGHELGTPTPVGLLDLYAEQVIVYGHTHRPLVHQEGSRLVVNPGAAGPRRFDIVPTVGRLTVKEGRAEVEIVALPIGRR